MVLQVLTSITQAKFYKYYCFILYKSCM